jgi:hypothetical protein
LADSLSIPPKHCFSDLAKIRYISPRKTILSQCLSHRTTLGGFLQHSAKKADFLIRENALSLVSLFRAIQSVHKACIVVSCDTTPTRKDSKDNQIYIIGAVSHETTIQALWTLCIARNNDTRLSAFALIRKLVFCRNAEGIRQTWFCGLGILTKEYFWDLHSEFSLNQKYTVLAECSRNPPNVVLWLRHFDKTVFLGLIYRIVAK